VDAFYSEPLLKTEGWNNERNLDEIVFENSWGQTCNFGETG